MQQLKRKILIVDDDESTRTMYAEVFRRNNFEVMEAIDGLDGMDQATKNKPDVIFTGIVMPRMDGFTLIETLKKNVATSSIPVFISSHMGREEDRKRAYDLGAKDFITRDFNTPNEVVKRISDIFKASDYKIKIDPTALDAPKLLADMRMEGVQCADCGGEMILALKSVSGSKEGMSAKISCVKCGKEK